MKTISFYVFSLSVLLLLLLNVVSTGCTTPKKNCQDCVAPDTVTALSPQLHPDSLHIHWDTVAAATSYRVKVSKITPLLIIKDTIVPSSSNGKLSLGGMPTGSALKVAVSSICKKGDLNCESTPTSIEIMSSDGGVVVMEDDLGIMVSFGDCMATCDNPIIASGTFRSDARGNAPVISWNACEDPNLNYYLIYMTPESGGCAPLYLKNVFQNELNYTPCGLCPSASFKYQVVGLHSLSPCLDMGRGRVSNCQ